MLFFMFILLIVMRVVVYLLLFLFFFLFIVVWFVEMRGRDWALFFIFENSLRLLLRNLLLLLDA